jgi:hypothetical protein
VLCRLTGAKWDAPIGFPLLPGNYMLFALDANGTPSVAAVMNIQ